MIPLANEAGKDGVLNYNTHTIAIQVPKTDLLKAPLANGNIGIYASASRPKIRILRGDGTFDANGPQVQVSRLGNPLINEVVIPIGQKDYWNASDPSKDGQFENRYTSLGYAEGCAGDERAMRQAYRRALGLDPAFSIRWAPVARAALRNG